MKFLEQLFSCHMYVHEDPHRRVLHWPTGGGKMAGSACAVKGSCRSIKQNMNVNDPGLECFIKRKRSFYLFVLTECIHLVGQTRD